MAALQDRCPHRFAPLSYGKLDGGVIECCYHGLCYDSSGACVSNPHGRLPGKTVKTYPVQEKHKLIWIWMGDAKADPAAIPTCPISTTRQRPPSTRATSIRNAIISC